MLTPFRSRDFALLWTAALISYAGDFALLIALTVHAYQLTGSALAGGGVMVASMLPRIVLGPIAGIFVDRWDRKRTMVWADGLRALILLPLVAAGSEERLWLLYAVPAVAATVGLVFGPAESALLPRLVDEGQLVAANALNSLNDNLGRLIGPAMGGLLYARFGIEGAVLFDAATYAVAAVLIALIRTDARPQREDLARPADRGAVAHALVEWKDGLAVVRQTPGLRTIFASQSIGQIGDGTFGALALAPLITTVLGGSETDVGLIASAQAVGGLIAGLVVARMGGLSSPRRLLGGGLIGLGLCDLTLGNAANIAEPGRPALLVGGAAILLAGFPVVAFSASQTSLLQRMTADAFRGRVFAAYRAVSATGTLIGLTIGGYLGDEVGIVPIVSAGACMWIVAGVVALVGLKGNAIAEHVESGRGEGSPETAQFQA